MLTGAMTNRRSNAKTAYGLMSDIRAYILEEPKRIWMKDWLIQGPDDIQMILDSDGPICGTVGCIAGNALILRGLDGEDMEADVLTDALDLLTGESEDGDFYSDLYALFHSVQINAKYGTQKYADIVAALIEESQEHHSQTLKKIRL